MTLGALCVSDKKIYKEPRGCLYVCYQNIGSVFNDAVLWSAFQVPYRMSYIESPPEVRGGKIRTTVTQETSELEIGE